MKDDLKHMKQLFIAATLLISATGLVGFLIPVQAIGDHSVADEIISLNVTDRPLGEVLENISIAVNCQFSIDKTWEDYPISASFDNEPLYRGLKIILQDINNAVIYGADRTIKIIVYDSNSFSGQATGKSAATQSPQDFIQQSVISGNATAPQPEAEIAEGSDDPEDSEGQPEEADESDAETNEADAESTGNREGASSDTSSEGDTAAAESEANESAPDEENFQTEESESKPGGSENSESLENSEEGNPN